jgi:FAD binding domain
MFRAWIFAGVTADGDPKEDAKMQSTVSSSLSGALRRRGFSGITIEPHNPEYERARRVWNGTVDRRPELVARPLSVADVPAAVGLARDLELPLAVRGGGHSIAGHSTCDEGLVIDLRELRHVTIDWPASRWAAGSATSRAASGSRSTAWSRPRW